jgi:3-methyladenine DNA glycosylase AlkD
LSFTDTRPRDPRSRHERGVGSLTYRETIEELKRLGTAQNIKVYKRHGAGDNLFGVSFANLEKLRKEIKVDHRLAIELWQSENIDARSLAVLIADPQQMNAEDIESWVRGTKYYVLIDLIVRHLAGKSTHAQQLMERWTRSDDDQLGQAGWGLLAVIAMEENRLEDRYFEEKLAHIERHIHKAKNRTRHAMNSALIAIGIRHSSLQTMALAVARRIGTVEVDHGETGCKTPDAVQYILKTVARRKKASKRMQ